MHSLKGGAIISISTAWAFESTLPAARTDRAVAV
jgi:hypothetical protein